MWSIKGNSVASEIIPAFGFVIAGELTLVESITGALPRI
jgi:hypothetical protein